MRYSLCDPLTLSPAGSNGSGEVLMPPEIDSMQGLTLSLQVFSSMVGAHLELQLQRETRMIVEQRTISCEQVECLGNMMKTMVRTH